MAHTLAGRTSHVATPAFAKDQILAVYTKLLVVAVFILVTFGALVTSHDAGLAVPDWPTSFGENMFLFPASQWVGGIFYEHVHRLIASGIGLLTVILFLMTRSGTSKKVRSLSALAVILVVLQGLLGGATVLYGLPDGVSVAHGVLGQSFFALTICIAYLSSQEARTPQLEPLSHPATDRLSRASLSKLQSVSLLGIGAVFLQLLVGAWMRHSGSGLAIPDFPTMGGSFLPYISSETMIRIQAMRSELGLPPASSLQVTLHLIHRVFGVIVAGVVLIVASRAVSMASTVTEHDGIRRDLISQNGLLLGCLVLTQFLLGVISVLSERDPLLTSLHVACGALLLGASVLLSLRLFGPYDLSSSQLSNKG